MNLSRFGKFTRVSDAAAAGTSAVNGSSVDMRGYTSVTFVLALGSVTTAGAGAFKAQQSSDNSTFSDLEGTSLAYTDADGNKLLILEVHQPRERYVRPVITRSTANSVIDGVIAVQTGAGDEPVTHDSTVAAAEFHLAPAEGAA